ncbi:MAG: hypothetical protein MUO19_07125 [Dehalococcoidales bacterium]|nr:hypothetical protein [Dehalococcoidales bacterium]
MTDIGILFVVVWIGCFIVVSVDSAYQKTSPVFWRLAGLFGGPFALVAWGIVRGK